tara:strand:- start:56 stop:787 length:732 start_codon:yes stop_codon:yes gene_type:complete
MILYPAVDLKDGQCVRLLRGEMDRATVFSEDPVRQVKKFFDQGFEWLHIVDLNGAIQGRAVHKELIKEMVCSTELEVQLGGGIRSMEVLEAWIDVGVSRVVLGTAALYNPELVRNACKEHPGRIAVGIDGRDGRVAVKGWVEQSEILAIDLARRFEDEGVSLIIFTDIARDGAMSGVNLETTAALASALSIPVVASGGVASMEDLEAVKGLESVNVVGVIVGRALYEGGIDAQAAIELMQKPC